MISIARTLDAPVLMQAGNVARTSIADLLARKLALDLTHDVKHVPSISRRFTAP